MTAAGGLGLLAAACVVRLLVGGESVLGLPGPDGLELRGQAVVVGCLVGGALGLAGVLLQSLLRNPLASPDLMGLSPGAGLAVMIGAAVAHSAGGGLESWGDHGPAAVIGALGSLAVVFVLSQRGGLIDPVSMVLVGVILGLIFGAASVLVQVTLPDRGLAAARWLLGGLSDRPLGWREFVVGVLVLGALGWAWWRGGEMDAASMSEDEARSVGVRLGRLRAVQFVLAGLLTAGSVVLAGPIGFVGLVCPHAARLLGGPGHRWLAVSAALLGAALVVLADAGVMSVRLPVGRVPIGVVTSLLGGPVFIGLLWRERRG